jgi:PAS domain-containing protein
MKRSACLLLVAALCSPAFAATDPSTTPSVSAAPELGREGWQKRIREAREDLAQARARSEAALRAYTEVRHRGRGGGARKQQALKERKEAEVALAEAERRLEELLDQARRAGVPPGWIRDASGPSPAAPQP